MATEKSSVKPAAERTISGGAVGRAAQPKGSQRAGSKSTRGPLGPRIPEHMRKALEGLIAQRIERDVVAQKTLRAEAVGLLETFIKEESVRGARDARGADAARRALLGDRARAVRRALPGVGEEARRSARPGPRAELRSRPRAFCARAQGLQKFRAYDLALYVDGFLATEQGKQDEALDRFNRILEEYPKSRFVPDAHMARAEAAFNGKYDYAGALAEYEKVMQYPQSDLYGLALFKSAWCQWRLGRSDEAAQAFLASLPGRPTQAAGFGAEAEAARRAPGRGAQVPGRGLHRGREEHRATTSTASSSRQAATGSPARSSSALAAAFYEQAHYERGIEAYELMLKLEPAGPEAPELRARDRAGLRDDRRLAEAEATYERFSRTYTLPEPGHRRRGLGAGADATPRSCKAAQADIEKQLREDAHQPPRQGAARQDEPRRVRGRGGALRGLSLQVRQSRSRVRGASSAWPRSTSTTWARTATPRRTTWRAARATPRDQLIRTTRSTTPSPRSSGRASPSSRRRRRAGETEVDKKFTEAIELYMQLYPERSRRARAPLPSGQAVLRPRGLRRRGEGVGTSPREVPELQVRRRRRRAHPRLVQPGEGLLRTSRPGRAG